MEGQWTSTVMPLRPTVGSKGQSGMSFHWHTRTAGSFCIRYAAICQCRPSHVTGSGWECAGHIVSVSYWIVEWVH